MTTETKARTISDSEVVACCKCGQELRIPPPSPSLPKSIRNAAMKNVACEKCCEKVAEEDSADPREMRAEQDILRLIPPIYRKTVIEDLPEVSREAVQTVLNWKYSPNGLLLVGESRRGKTRAAFLLLERLIREGYEVESFSAGGIDFGGEVSRRFADSVEAAVWMKRLKNVDLVFIDDCGKWAMTDRVQAQLFSLVEARTANEKPMIFTMNQGSLNAMQQQRLLPLKERIKEFFSIITFN